MCLKCTLVSTLYELLLKSNLWSIFFEIIGLWQRTNWHLSACMNFWLVHSSKFLKRYWGVWFWPIIQLVFRGSNEKHLKHTITKALTRPKLQNVIDFIFLIVTCCRYLMGCGVDTFSFIMTHYWRLAKCNTLITNFQDWLKIWIFSCIADVLYVAMKKFMMMMNANICII